MKDYYSILDCTPMSSRDEIKKRYRQLAHQFHPDKNDQDKYAAARFHDIKEAYETLTQPARKEAWLQERWLHQAMNINHAEKQPLTPFSILEKVLKLDRYVASQDIFRMDHTQISERIMALVSDENIRCMIDFDEKEMNKTIVQYLLSAAGPIEVRGLSALWPKLERIADGNHALLQDIKQFQDKKKKKQQQDQLTVPMAILFTVILCLLIYLAGR